MSGIIPFLINCLLLAGLIAGASYLEKREQAPEFSNIASVPAATTSDATPADASTKTTVQTNAPQISAPSSAKPSIRGVYHDDEDGRDD